jgi:hypothetical protein
MSRLLLQSRRNHSRTVLGSLLALPEESGAIVIATVLHLLGILDGINRLLVDLAE